MFFFLINYFIVLMVILGFGLLSQKILLNKVNYLSNIGLIGFFGLLFIFLVSSLIHFFINFNNLIVYLVYSIGFISFIFFFFKKNIERKKLLILFLISIIFLPISIIAEPNEDFFLYYYPYIKYLESSKIIFGITNLNDFLAYSTNSLYDIIILLQLPIFEHKSYSIPILFFYIFFVVFLIDEIIKKQDIFYLIILSLSLVTFAKLRDFGTSIPPQLLLILIGCLIYDSINKKFNQQKITSILFLTLFAFILRFNSIVIFPILIFFSIYNLPKLFFYINKNKIVTLYLSVILFLFIAKNFIHSGCLLYPVPQLCFNNLNWSSDKIIVQSKYNKFKSDSKGWPFYAKEKFRMKSKFVWKNLIRDDFAGYNQYGKLLPTFWFKYWIQDPQYKKIINLALISFCIFILLIVNIKNKSFKKIENNKNLFLLLFSFLSIILWFFLSPQLRYGGFFCFIFFFSLLFKSLFNIKFDKSNNINVILILCFSLCYVQIKNLNRINNDLKEDIFINFPWPNYIQLKHKEDYVIYQYDNQIYNKRIYSDNLIFDNNGDYILMCGGISFPCISDGKEICIGEKKVKNNYNFYLKKINNENCFKFMNNNILY